MCGSPSRWPAPASTSTSSTWRWSASACATTGEHFQLPLPDGPGKALFLTVHPVRKHIPIYLASVGPKNLELTGEIADGWLAVFLSTEFAQEQLTFIQAGRERAGKTMDGFDVVASAPLSVGADVTQCAAPIRPYAALYIGGMGSREQNFYNNLAVRMGYEAEAAEVQQRYLSRDYEGAWEAVPEQFIDATSLLGPPGRIARRMAEFAAAGVTTLSVSPQGSTDRGPPVRVARCGRGAGAVRGRRMTLFQAIVLGIVQGLTEFFPVSSTAHLRIVPALLGWHFYNSATGTSTNDPGAAFTAVIQLGTTVAVVLYFWRELVHVLAAWFHGIRDASHRESLEYRMGWYLIIATIPVSVFGLAFSHQIETAARNLWVISTALIVLRDRAVRRRQAGHARPRGGGHRPHGLDPRRQRPGARADPGRLTLGHDDHRGPVPRAGPRGRGPVLVPAVHPRGRALRVCTRRATSATQGAPGAGLTAVALICAFVVGLASIHWLMRWLASHNTYRFVYYRIGLGLLVMGLLAGGVLDATT